MGRWGIFAVVFAAAVVFGWPPPVVHAGGYRVTQVWGDAGDGWGQLSEPKSAAVAADGSVWAVDYHNETLLKYEATGELLACWGGPGSQPGKFRQASRVAVAADGTVFVTDSANQRIQCFSQSGAFLREWGEAGRGQGQFALPRGIAVANGEVFVTDQNNCRVQVFTPRGEFIRQWGSKGDGRGGFRFPKDVAVGPGGRVYVVDARSHRVQIFTTHGKWLGWFGGKGTSRGRLWGPRGLEVGRQGHVFVADTMNHRIQEFTGGGKYVREWGCKGSMAGLLLEPRDVAEAPDASLVVADTYNRRLQRFVKDDSADEKAPTTRCDTPAGWSSSPLKPALSALDDQSDIVATYASIDGSRFASVDGPLSLGTQGLHSVSYLSVDAAGNQEPVRRRVFRLDWTAPRIRFAALQRLRAFPGERVLAKCTVADRYSPDCRVWLGVERYARLVWRRQLGRVRSSAAGWPLRLSFIAPREEGRYNLVVRARDLAGNPGRQTIELVVSPR